MNSLDLLTTIFIVITLLTLPAFLFKYVVKGSKYESEAHIFVFMLDVLFSCTLYFSMILRNPSQSGVYITGMSIVFFAIMYYKTRKFYLHRYN